MIPSPFTAHRPLDIDSSSSQKILSAGEQHTHSGYYRPSGQGDIFLFSPSLCSRPSNESTSLSSCSFDTLSYSFSPTDLSSAPKPFSPSPLVPGTTRSRSPLFVEAYLSGSEPNPVTRFSPSTPFQELFNSSPAGYWQANSLSVSPISRHSSAPAEQDPADADEEDCEEDIEKAPSRKIESLLQYGKVQDIPDSPPAPRASSPSTLSSLSSVPSSPSALFSGAPVASSQTSQGPTPSSSPSNNPSLPSPLASPFKLFPKAATRAAPGTPTRRRSRRLQPMHGTASRGLAAEILNQLGRSRLNVADAPKPNISPPFKLSSSPMPNLSDSDDENYEPVAGARCNTNKRAHARNLAQTSLSKRKKRRTETTVRASSASSSNSAHSASTSTSHALASVSRGETAATEECATDYPNRTFPLRIPIHDNFPLFYRRFPVSSVIDEVLAAANDIIVFKVPDAIPNSPRDVFDLYTPRFVKGKGTSKVGLCPICHESVARGGEGKKVWLSMKFSAFNYHMQYAHGISATTGLPFSPPTGFRTITRTNAGRHEKTRIMEGKCHKCKKWVPVEGIKDVPSKVKEIFWWKHAAACHQGSTIEGEGDTFVEDEVYTAVAGQGDCQEDGDGEDLGERSEADIEVDAEMDEGTDRDAEGSSVHEDDNEL